MLSVFGLTLVDCWVNVYRGGGDCKSWHHDNFQDRTPKPTVTIGLSLGETRDLAFQHTTTGEEFRVSQANGDVFAFDEVFNRDFKHSVPPVRGGSQNASALRISVILWANEMASVPTVIRNTKSVMRSEVPLRVDWFDWNLMPPTPSVTLAPGREIHADMVQLAPDMLSHIGAKRNLVSLDVVDGYAGHQVQKSVPRTSAVSYYPSARQSSVSWGQLLSDEPAIEKTEAERQAAGGWQELLGDDSDTNRRMPDVGDSGGKVCTHAFSSVAKPWSAYASTSGNFFGVKLASSMDTVAEPAEANINVCQTATTSNEKWSLTTSHASEAPKDLLEDAGNVKCALTLQGAQQVLSILRGAKLIENRSWKIPCGWHAIHSGAQMVSTERADRVRQVWPDAPAEETLPHRAIMGLFYVEEHRTPEQCRAGYIWARGPVCHVISKAIEFRTCVPCGGDKGNWALNEVLRSKIRLQLLDATVRTFDLSAAI